MWKNSAQMLRMQREGRTPASKELVSETGKEAITKQHGRCPNQATSKYNAFREHKEKNVALNPSSVDYSLVYREASSFCRLNNIICICICGFFKA